jgi:hypothetical protein
VSDYHVLMVNKLAEARARITKLERALQTLLDEHSCDDGSADYDGTATECERCSPASSLLAETVKL